MTTNATLKSDLEASVKASAPAAQLRALQAQVTVTDAKLEQLIAITTTINDNTIVLIDALKELVVAQSSAADSAQRVMAAMARVVERANQHLDREDVEGNVQ